MADWSSSLFGFMEDGECPFTCLACLFPCVGFGEMLQEVKMVHNCMWPALSQCCCYGAAVGITFNAHPLSAMALGMAAAFGLAGSCQRATFRYTFAKKHGIDENPCHSCFVELMCYGCSMSQIHHTINTQHLEIEHETKLGGLLNMRKKTSRVANIYAAMGIVRGNDKVIVKSNAPVAPNSMVEDEY